MLVADGAEPVLPAHGVDVVRLGAGRREPVGPFPAELAAEHGAAIFEALLERRDNAVAAGLVLLVREGDSVVLPICFERAILHPVAVAVQITETADIDDPEV